MINNPRLWQLPALLILPQIFLIAQITFHLQLSFSIFSLLYDKTNSIAKNLPHDKANYISRNFPKFKQTTFPGIFLYRSSTKGGARPVNPVAQKIMDRYKKDGQVAPSGEDVQWRTYMRSVNEAALCLQEEIIANPVCARFKLNLFYPYHPFILMLMKFFRTIISPSPVFVVPVRVH